MSDHWTAQYQREQLHTAAQDGDLARVEELLQAKYPVNRFDDLGNTPLHYAVAAGHLDVVRRLIKAGANVNAHDDRVIGDTPLNGNADTCSFEMAKVLLEAGADPTLRGWMQPNALDRAEKRKDGDAKKIQKMLKEAAVRRRI